MFCIGSNNVKYRWYTFVVYKEDITLTELVDIMTSSKLPTMISPCHDKDVITEDDIEKYKKRNMYDENLHILGSPKKAHWHLIVEMPYAKQPKASLNYINDSTGLNLSYCSGVLWFNVLCRYMCHLDESPKKAQYSQTQCVYLNGFNADFTLPTPPKSKRVIRRDLLLFIRSNPYVTFTDVVIAFMDDDEVSEFIEKKAFYVKSLIQDQNFSSFAKQC